MSTWYKGKQLRIFKTSIINGKASDPGSIIEASEDRLIIGTGKDALRIMEIQMEGRKKMHINDFLRGTNMRSGELLGK
jgi:methionyl-tRNA formyltransferase